ncbi:MAG: alpha/beta hydrolase [Candidatus Thiodiazotropha lotti]|nr:alpha/beta hydrolase [Candidatus Thiodiazotropha lotti]MCG7922703.1 alpha/beta hydrolase [Candidatus Thiodiazotropha lotti]MCG8003302.1 alpha/beta hydrolase [Candidatus Thiodiazotropha lotti]MCG8007568.1 alpha/beta hydrolase [Candidatus Thiodiazotropha lotti]MCW4186924.1 alpha/beta hydrolase [Candidatus Thiodiazotropha lotti]
MPLSTTQAISAPSKRKNMHKRTPIQCAFSALTRVSPYLAGRLATFFWYRTQHRSVTLDEQRVLARASTEVRRFGTKSVCIYRWGEGAPVLLTHGWNGNAGQMASLVEALVGQGFQVTAFDAPGHGQSSGNSTDILEISGVITQLLQESGEDTAVVAHSFGGMCTLHAIANGARASSVVCISPPKDVTTLLQQFIKILGMNTTVVNQVKRRLEQRFGEEMWSRLSLPEWVRAAELPGLIIHDSRDRYIPVSNARAVHAAWTGSELQITRGLGHMRILQNTEVINSVERFLLKPGQ